MDQVTNEKDLAIVSWVMSRVTEWETHRRTNYDQKWEEYDRLVTGTWSSEDKGRESERSKLISPALAQAVETSTAELEEAIFGRDIWFDIADDVMDEDRSDMAELRVILAEDINRADMESEIRRTIYNGCVYGTGISKITVEDTTDLIPVADIDPLTGLGTTIVESRSRFLVSLRSINPYEFAIEPGARSIEEALGCAHIMSVPRNVVLTKQQRGIYKDGPLGSGTPTQRRHPLEVSSSNNSDNVRLIEYYGLVPKKLLAGAGSILSGDLDDLEMVEATVVIGNDTMLLRASESPMLMKDRPIVAYQHHTVNDSFWGKGIAKSGYNAQKALDSELRGRIDAMAMTIHPMIGVDATMIPRGFKPEIKPGKMWLSNGDPRSAFLPMTAGSVSPSTFSQSADLERMVTMATGVADNGAPSNVNAQNTTASGFSMANGGMVKRLKRSLRNIETQYLSKIIKKAAFRYMQFSPERYPVMDYQWKTLTGLGMIAREVEQQQLTQLLSLTPQDSPVFGVLLQGIVENSSLTNKLELTAALQQQLAPPPPEQVQQQQELQDKQVALQEEIARADIEEANSRAARNMADAEAKLRHAKVAEDNVEINEHSAITKSGGN
jgi:hypothetical protein